MRVMSVKAERLKGYLLEEALAYLLRNAGYRLLVDPRQDPASLEWRGNALAVRGRGATHQVDVVGDVGWISAFAWPVRLWLEARFKTGKAGIEEVRNALGVLQDINTQGYSRSLGHPGGHRYVYVLFSAAGFTKPAAELALAHDISLVDMSGGEYAPLLGAVGKAAGDLAAGIASFKRAAELFEQPDSGLVADNAVTRIRYCLRRALGTLPEDWRREEEGGPELARLLTPVVEAARQCGEVFVAMSNGPFMVLLKADNPAAFIERMTVLGTEKVTVTWSRSHDGGRIWSVRPAADEDAYRLSFRLPDALVTHVLAADSGRQRASPLPSLAVYRRTAGGDQIFRLNYDPDINVNFQPE